MVTIAMKLEDIHCLEKIFDQAKQHIKKQRHYFANKSQSSQKDPDAWERLRAGGEGDDRG